MKDIDFIEEKIITTSGIVHNHLNELPSGVEYIKNFFTEYHTTNFIKVYLCSSVEFTIKMN